ncbi:MULTISPECIES: hypothetical protein [Cellulomonas]|uniref:Uncharacterized protein n=2 Tax=Actinomycetes TaxID=1760 RepID=A0ABU0GJG9_9CELL|nr:MULTISPECIES: hypothetical protein [Cellulomonas]MBO9569622.1 hypothetical protein [Cellulomonas iranensis]MDQ0425525.1 hypothetical protein [Cellulomonas iranensis]
MSSAPGPYPAPDQPASGPWPGPPPRPRRTSVTGPVWLTAVGVVLLLGALVAFVATIGGFVGAVRSDVLTNDGRPGAAVLASADAPGATEVVLTAGERYAVYLVVPRDAVRDDERPELAEDVLLMAPSGAVVEADGSPGVSMQTGAGGRVAATVGAFTAPESGRYTVAVPPADASDAWVAIAADKPFGPFFGSVVGTVLGVFVVIGLSAAGFGMTLGGAIWWVLRVRARRAAA